MRERARTSIRALSGLGVLSAVVLLLSWGLSAMQWTVLTTNNDLRDAVANGELFQSQTRTYTIPQGTENDVLMGAYFQGNGLGAYTAGNFSLFFGLAEPVSNATTTIQYYVSFTVSRPNGSAVNTWFTSPQGNLTQTCGDSAVVTCLLPPNPPSGGGVGPQSQFFQVPTAGNYTVHLLSTQCPADGLSGYCTSTSTNATITVTRALSRVVDTRPYYNSGLETVIVAGVAIAATIAFLLITGYQIIARRRRVSSTRVSPRSPMAEYFEKY